MQQLLWDRRLVLRVLDTVEVPTPRRLITHRGDDPVISPDIIDRLQRLDIQLPTDRWPIVKAEMLDYDTVKVGDETIKKPFVEKPVSGEDHNIYIYYSQATGGGVRKLFRKASQCLEYSDWVL